MPAASQQLSHKSLAIDDARPVAKGLEELGAKNAFFATYEDPPFAYVDDVKDVTLEVRKDLDKFPPGRAPKVLVPRGGTLTVNYGVRADTGKPINPLALVQSLVDAQDKSVNGGKFRVLEVDGGLHIVPSGARDRSGKWKQLTSILDAEIVVPEGSRDVTQKVIAICEAVTKTGRAELFYGKGPNQFPMSAPAAGFGANGEKARTALVRALSFSRKRVAWQIFYAPDVERYFLNLHFVPENEASAR